MNNQKPNIKYITRQLISFLRQKEQVVVPEEIDELWADVKKKIQQDTKAKRRKYIISIVTSAAIIFGVFWFSKYYKLAVSTDFTNNTPSRIDSALESQDILLIVSDQKQIKLKSDSIVLYSKNGTIILQSDTIVAQSDTNDKIEYNQLIVPKGKRIQLVLPDASKLWVNSGTVVTYPRQFNQDEREITVNGEVYLEVKHDIQRPFIVNTNDFHVRVLGTSFNVCNYKKLESSVVLLNGSVSITDFKGNTTKLNPNQLVTVGEKGLEEIKDVDASDYIGWVNNMLILHAEPLENILGKLGIYYGVSFEFTDKYTKNLPLSGKLDLTDKIEDIMYVISKTAPIKYEIKDNRIIVENKK